MVPTPFEKGMAIVQEHYAERINAAVAAGHMELVQDLTNEYANEALQLMLSTAVSPSPLPDTMEFGPVWSHGHGSAPRRLLFWRHRTRRASAGD